MKKKIVWTIVVLVIIIGGIALIKARKSKENKLPVANSYAMVVSTVTPKYNKTQLTLPYIALVQNDADVNLSTKIAGRVDFIKPSGSKVKKGEVIVKLDDTDIRSNISSVGSQIDATGIALKNLKATHQRTLELMAVKGASIEQSQNEESHIASLEAQLESLKQKRNEANNMLSYAVIKAPVDGTLSKAMLNVGDVAMPGHPVATISAANGSYFLVRVPGDVPVRGVKYQGQFYEALHLNSTFNGLSEYKVYVNNQILTTGSREQVDVVVFDGEGIKLPQDAILNRDGKSYAMVVDGNQAKTQEVNILQTGEEGIVVDNKELLNKKLVVAKQDILLKLASGVSLKIKN